MIKFALFFIILILIWLLPYSPNSMIILGYILFFLSVVGVLINKKKSNVLLLLSILAVTNLSLVYGCYWYYDKYASIWQIPLLHTKAQYDTAKIVVLWYAFFLFGFQIMQTRTKALYKIDTKIINKEGWNMGFFLFILSYLFLYFILIFEFVRTKEEYVSGATALYEYAIVLFFSIWLFMPQKKICRWLMLFFSFLYILQGFLFGDRSSAIPMVILLFILISKNINAFKLTLLSIIGIIGANFVGIYRNIFVISDNLLSEAINRLFYVDSVAFSFYAGIQIVKASSVLISEKANLFGAWFISLFVGSGGISDYHLTDYRLPYYIQSVSDSYVNYGGGMTSPYFYFWFGDIGVIISGFIYGLIVGKIFSKSSPFFVYLQIILTFYALRWYVYGPTSFFRTCIIIPAILYAIILFYKRLKLTKIDSC